MGQLRDRMEQDLILKGFRPTTKTLRTRKARPALERGILVKIPTENTQNCEKWRVNSEAREFATFFQLPVQDTNLRTVVNAPRLSFISGLPRTPSMVFCGRRCVMCCWIGIPSSRPSFRGF